MSIGIMYAGSEPEALGPVMGRARLVLVGDERELPAQIDRMRDPGVTDFDAAIAPVAPGVAERTPDLPASVP